MPDLKVVKKLTAKLEAGKVKEPSAGLSPITLDVSTYPTDMFLCITVNTLTGRISCISRKWPPSL